MKKTGLIKQFFRQISEKQLIVLFLCFYKDKIKDMGSHNLGLTDNEQKE